MVDQESHEDSVDNSVSVTRHKIIFVGDAGVGKTSIINRIVDNPFSETYEMSIGVDFMSKNIRYRGTNVKLQIWDSAGQEKYKGLIPSYVRNASIVFVCYDISNKTSYENVPKWINFIKAIENTTLVLCGNKTDLQNREVEKSTASNYAEKEQISFYEVSAKSNENIKKMFYSAVAQLPSFVNENNDLENVIKELLQENGVDNVPEGNTAGGNNALQNQINVGGNAPATTAAQKTKKEGCKC